MCKRISEIIEFKEYDFIRNNIHLKDKIIFLTLAGSYAYGTNVESSDIDIRGCALNSRSDILGLSSFDQFVDNQTDTTVYGFNKLVSLLLNCNPNCIELLGCKQDQYCMVGDIGREMLRNRKMFLSKRAIRSFGGYANQQLNRLENALARDKLPQNKREEHILRSMQNSLEPYCIEPCTDSSGEIRLYIPENSHDGFAPEIMADISLHKYPARKFNNLMNQLTNVLGAYTKLSGRNKKKDNAHLNKHAMHLIRLYLMCIDILEKEEVITYREKDRRLLLDIRNGMFQNDDGTYRDEFFDMVNDLDRRMLYAKENTSLPDNPDLKAIEEFVISVNERSI